MIRGIIFDMDGVIADSLGAHNKSFIRLFEKYGVKLTKKDIQSTYGRTAKENLTYFKHKYKLKISLNVLIKERDSIFMDNMDSIKEIPGAIKLVKELNPSKKLVVASSSRRQIIKKIFKHRNSTILLNGGLVLKPQILSWNSECAQKPRITFAISNMPPVYDWWFLTKLKIENFFDVVVSSEDVFKSKPNPDIFLFTQRKLGLKKNELIVMEDSQNGIMAAKRAKIKSIAIPNKYTKNEDFSSADYIAKSISEVKRII